MPWKLILLLCLSLLQGVPAAGNPVISEFMADNETTLPDEDGAFSDWIEIHNPTTAAIPLGGWYLTDKAANLTQWQFPAVILAPGEFLIVWASGKNRSIPGAPLHTNFSLAKGGEFLALVMPDGTTLAQSFAPEFPAQNADTSFGLRFQSQTLIAQGASGRYKIATSSTNPAATWNQQTFADSTWTTGISGFGFGVTVPGISVRQVSKNGNIQGLDDALNLISLSPGNTAILSSTTVISETLNVLGEGEDGHYGYSRKPPGGSSDNYVIVATGSITIPTAGSYTFGLKSDDGGRITIDGIQVMRDDSFHGPQDSFGTVTLSAAQHTFEVVMFEGGGGDSVEFFAAAGTLSAFDAVAFHLVGDVANGGLAVNTTPTDAGGLVATNISSAMSGRTTAFVRLPFSFTPPDNATTLSLLMRYNDGFIAWLNGAAVASANAPTIPLWNSTAITARGNDPTLRRQSINLTSSIPALTRGTNMLAIQGLRSTLSDTSFLLLPELIAGNLDAGAAPAFYGGGLATPGWINGAPSSLGEVADTQFTIKRGFHTAPISVGISSATPGAVIRYTKDGSTPSATHGSIYSTPLTLSSTTVLRAIATLEGWQATDVDTQSYLFPNDIITQSSNGTPPVGWPASSGTSQVLDYGMDPEIVNHANPDIGGALTVKSALLALPSVSITTDLTNFFNINDSQGIYSNPDSRGFAWERPVSLEWISPPDAANPAGTGEFQINAGLRLRGGFSRSTENPKHAFRLFFREEYGATKLRYPLFGRDAAQEFDKIDFRTAQNYSWSFGGDDQNTFLREESIRQTQLDMGQPGSHVRYVHLYLNGQYWGLYNLDERTEASFSESYLGGNKDDYDVVKAEQEADYTIGATDGNLAAWQDLWNKGKAHRASPTLSNYFRLMGLGADGVSPSADPVLLDLDNLIDYLLLTFWSGNLDGCVSSFLGENRANNWYGSRLRTNNPRQGFRFFAHDFEHSLFNVNEDRTGPFNSSNESNFAYSNPLFLHQDLTSNAEYRLRWADRIHRHLFNGGALTPEAWQNRINKLAAFVDVSIAAESARWGDSKTTIPYNRQDWINAQNSLLTYLIPRGQVVLNQLRADNLYPNLSAPVISPFGGHQVSGVKITIQGPIGGTLYYMADGSDPRAVGGELRAGALIYNTATTGEFLVPWSASDWKYLGTGSNQGTAWRASAFSDITWPTGKAELGYGDGDEATVIPIVDIASGISGVQKPATYYFRRKFTASDISKITSLSLTVEYDDAYAVYLNGTRVAGNLPSNPAYNFYTGAAIEDLTETTTIPQSLLLTGSNTIAVEVHQAANSSSDLSMNLSLTATRSSTPTTLILNGTGERKLRVRAKSDATWSAMAESTYQVGTVTPTAADLIVSEIAYFPKDPYGDAEFIELLNVSATTLDLAGARFTEGLDFTFPSGQTLAPGARVIVVRNLAAFEALHGTDKPVAGIFANGSVLSNSGERLRLESPTGGPLLDFTYGNSFPWPASASGLGRSMILADPSDPSNPDSWRPSAGENGNPGRSDSFGRAPGQNLLDHALASANPSFNPSTAVFSVKRRLGADNVTLSPEWSNDLTQWSPSSFSRLAETPDSAGNSLLQWQLHPSPPGRTFLRIRVSENP